jgi:hypothetical protein
MLRCVALAALALLIAIAPVTASEITGKYVEARTCDVWTGPCFANGDMNLTGKHAVMAWKVDKGTFENAKLDGLSVVAVIAASDTLGLKQTGPSRVVMIVDRKASTAQRTALIHLAQKQGGKLLKNVVAIHTLGVDLKVYECKGGACADLLAGEAKIKTRCLDEKHDKACGNEWEFYPPLSKGVKVKAATAVDHQFTGKGLKATWKDSNRRGAYVGSFAIR